MADVEHKYCLKCGYILDNLPQPRCPECGATFDPARASTYASNNKSALPDLLIVVGALLAFIASFVLVRAFPNVHALGAPPCLAMLVSWFMFVRSRQCTGSAVANSAIPDCC